MYTYIANALLTHAEGQAEVGRPPNYLIVSRMTSP